MFLQGKGNFPSHDITACAGQLSLTKATTSSSQPHSASEPLSTYGTSPAVFSSSALVLHTSDASVSSSAAASSASKRSYSEKAKITQVPRAVFIPVAVYGHTCLGILFTASSIRGSGATVFCVDLELEAEQNEVLERLEESRPHPDIVVPFKNFKASRKNETCTALGAIRAFLDAQLAGFPMENCALSVSVSELRQAVKYFWGVHDFVRGVRGAMLGHKYLNHDISENNIVRPGEEGSYLIDFDMAIFQEPEEPSKAAVTTKREGLYEVHDVAKSSSPIPADEVKPLEAMRTVNIFSSLSAVYHLYKLKGTTPFAANRKDASLGPHKIFHSAELKACLKQNWATGLHAGIKRLLGSLWARFADSLPIIEQHVKPKL
ncbi:hypothetical protein PAXINDRAFT_9495 [Paxillus involutus ATCC 200175]|nr:hypothetical protein PAXINDRAFT_9495 [Paxillus involutus ATCC 200175]